MRYGLEVHRGRAEPIVTTTEVSGSREGGVSTTVTTTFEMDGSVVEFEGVVPFRAGDEVVVAGKRDKRGVINAYAVRLPRQGVMLGSSTACWVGGAIVLAIGCVIMAVNVSGLYDRVSAENPSERSLFDQGLPGLVGLVVSIIGTAIVWRGMVIDYARGLVTRATASPPRPEG